MKRKSQQVLVLTTLLALMSWGFSKSTPNKVPASALKGKKLTPDLGKTQTVKNSNDIESSVVLNDPAISQKWGLKKADVSRAWELSQGDRNIVVAVVDTGIDVNHEDLKNNLWTNPGETGTDSKGRNKATNGIDDDGNGFVDDVHGWNFVSNNHDLADNHGHGTHIAGIIGAEAGNNKGVSGVAPKVQMMVLKYYDPKVPNTDNLKNTIKAFRYATKMNAHIINYSGGGLEFSLAEYNAVKKAQDKGILFVAAAGNERSNSDYHKYYPADYDLQNIISVTAIDPKLKVLASSNFGVKTVDIAAPGQNILSTLPQDNYGYMTGTSQATGFVTGAAVVVKANNPDFDYNEVKRYILSTGDHEPSLVAKTGTSRRLNLFKALVIKDQGVAVNGVVAANTGSMQDQFTAGRAAAGVDPANAFSAFGQQLMDSVRKSGQEEGQIQ